MNLISCDDCATVLDADKLNFPREEDIWKEDGSINIRLASYDHVDEKYKPRVMCPVCDADIFKP